MDQDLTRGAAALEKSLDFLERVVADAGSSPLPALAGRAGLPISTAERIVQAMMRQGMLSRTARGRYGPGLRLIGMSAGADTRSVLTAVARRPVRELARRLRATVHLGVLDGEMVTYLIKECGGGPALLTREMIQLEAYCSAVGKVLLASLDRDQQASYLAGGPFVALTSNTITDPEVLAQSLDAIRRQGFARDDAEVEDDLRCLAVPVRGPGGEVVAAISVSCRSPEPISPAAFTRLMSCSLRISRDLGAPAGQRSPSQSSRKASSGVSSSAP